MGTIRVGRDGQRSVVVGEIVANDVPMASETMNEVQKAEFIESVNRMPKEKRVSVLRSAGFNEEADDLERSLAEEHLREMNEKARVKECVEEGNGEENLAIEGVVGGEPMTLTDGASSSDTEAPIVVDDAKSPKAEPEKPKRVARARKPRAARTKKEQP